MTLPISVVVPHKTSRSIFFRKFCLPSIEANNPAQVIVMENDGSRGTGSPFRNAGAKKAWAPYLFFCDDDLILASDCLAKLLTAIEHEDSARIGYAYSDHLVIQMPENRTFEEYPVFLQRGRIFTPTALRTGPICSSMMLIAKRAFTAFDETVSQLDDWDLCLSMLEAGYHGIHVPEVLFHAYYLDRGVTRKDESLTRSVHAIQAKHKMQPGG